MFKNAIAYLVTPGFRFDAEILQRMSFQPCGSNDLRTSGFVPPCDHSTAGLVHAVGGMQTICWQTEDKLLPAAVVTEAVKVRAEKMEDEQGYKPGRKQMRELKERVVEELLPKAFTVKRKTIALLTDQYFMINTSSQARAEGLVECLSKALGGMAPLRHIATTLHPPSVMTGWAMGGIPEALTMDDLFVFSGEDREVKYKGFTLDAEKAGVQISEGFRVSSLAMTFDDRISFVLNEWIHLKRLELTDVAKLDNAEEKNAEGAMDAEITLMGLELCRLLDALIEMMGGIKPMEPDLVNQTATPQLAA